MKKIMVIASLVLVVLKILYDIYTFIYDKQNLVMERCFNIGIVFFIVYFGSISIRQSQKVD